jgi:hypothetical protein
MSQLQRSLALYQELIVKSVFYEKAAHGNYLSYAREDM